MGVLGRCGVMLLALAGYAGYAASLDLSPATSFDEEPRIILEEEVAAKKESLQDVPFPWINQGLADPKELVTLNFALKQRNLEELEKKFWAIADPSSTEYKKHLSHQEIQDLLQPTQETQESVLGFVRSFGVNDYSFSRHGDFLSCTLPVETAERMLDTKFLVFENAMRPGETYFRSNTTYSLPQSIASVVDFVGNVYRLPQKDLDRTPPPHDTPPMRRPPHPEGSPHEFGGAMPFYVSGETPRINKTEHKIDSVDEHHPRDHQTKEFVSAGLLQSQSYDCPGCAVRPVQRSLLETMYNYQTVPDGPAHQRNSQVVVQFFGNSYSEGDLDKFFKTTHRPEVSKVVGTLHRPSSEGSLDIQTILSVAPHVATEFWIYDGLRDDTQPRGEFNQEPFLKYMLELNSLEEPPLVHSISYADDESSLSREYMDRCNTEFMKAGIRGVTLVMAAGDDGVAGPMVKHNPEICDTHFVGQFPASSPYVLAVGGTISDGLGREHVCTTEAAYGVMITTGGGFSDIFEMPDYQKSAVNAWKKKAAALGVAPPSSLFNENGRAYPDVSAIGTGFDIVVGGRKIRVDGTSGSTPVVAGLISRLNDISLKNSGKPLGFINPKLYQLAKEHPEVFHDVEHGNNRCSSHNSICCAYGFEATEGWDPASGLGSLNFNAVADKLLAEIDGATLASDEIVGAGIYASLPSNLNLAVGSAGLGCIAIILAVAATLKRRNVEIVPEFDEEEDAFLFYGPI